MVFVSNGCLFFRSPKGEDIPCKRIQEFTMPKAQGACQGNCGTRYHYYPGCHETRGQVTFLGAGISYFLFTPSGGTGWMFPVVSDGIRQIAGIGR